MGQSRTIGAIMPYIRKRICSATGCNQYAEEGSNYCSEHRKKFEKRGTTSAFVPFYKTAWWRKHREAFLLKHIWCEECLKRGIHKTADTVHHRCGYNSWSTFCDISKWEAICASCHSKIHTTVTNEELYQKYNGDGK